MTRVILTPVILEGSATRVQMRAAGSLAARKALGALYLHTLGRSMPEIVTDAHGKPWVTCINNAQDSTADNFSDKSTDRIYISISHTDSYAAAVISDEGEVGIDIEGEYDSAKAIGIENRYLKNVNYNLLITNNGIDLYWLDIDKSGSPCEIIRLNGVAKISDLTDLNKIATARFECRWTLLEAVLKADGRGFGAYPEINSILPRYYATAFELEIDTERLYMSVAVKK